MGIPFMSPEPKALGKNITFSDGLLTTWPELLLYSKWRSD